MQICFTLKRNLFFVVGLRTFASSAASLATTYMRFFQMRCSALIYPYFSQTSLFFHRIDGIIITFSYRSCHVSRINRKISSFIVLVYLNDTLPFTCVNNFRKITFFSFKSLSRFQEVLSSLQASFCLKQEIRNLFFSLLNRCVIHVQWNTTW